MSTDEDANKAAAASNSISESNKAEPVKIDSPPLAPAQSEPAKIETASIDAPKPAQRAEPATPSTIQSVHRAVIAAASRIRDARLPPLAATLAIATALGVGAGAVGTISLEHMFATPGQVDNRAVRDALTRISSEIARLTANSPNSASASSTRVPKPRRRPGQPPSRRRPRRCPRM